MHVENKNKRLLKATKLPASGAEGKFGVFGTGFLCHTVDMIQPHFAPPVLREIFVNPGLSAPIL
jgi:hypothetical protein